MANDIAIPISFPDYLIAVGTFRLPHLGHAGILMINGESGLTKYFEYGRYDEANLGRVRTSPVPDVRIEDGEPTRASLGRTLARIARTSGQRGLILGAYIEVESGGFRSMLAYAERRAAENSDTARAPYDLMSNSCLHFAVAVAKAGGVDMPIVTDPRPVDYIHAVRGKYRPLSFELPDRLTIGTTPDFLSAPSLGAAGRRW